MSPVTASAVRLSTATVTQYLSSQQERLRPGKPTVVLLRAAPVWDGPERLTWERQKGNEAEALVAIGPSPLAVYELVLGHLSADDVPDVLVVLTDQEEAELGDSLLARVYRYRVNVVETWDVVRQAFGAGSTDSRLFAENWAAEALLDATPPGGWPRLPGGMLSRSHALSALASRRLGIGPYAPRGTRAHSLTGGRLDIHTLLNWSLQRGAADRFLSLRLPERQGLLRFLAEDDQAGQAGAALLALVEAGHGVDAVPLGMVCAALWLHATPSPQRDVNAEVYRARGRVERYFGAEPPAAGPAFDALISAFGRACEEFVTALMAAGRSASAEDAEPARRRSAAVIERAESLARQFGAEAAAATSPMLPSGLEARFIAVGHALADRDAARIADAVTDLGEHRLANSTDAMPRIERARMAARLARWLNTQPAVEVETVAAGIDRHIAETGWVDRALLHVEAGGDHDPVLAAAYDTVCADVRKRRREIDRRFAHALATWTAAGTSPGDMLTVETFLSRVVAPVVKSGERRLLLLVLDGMSASIAAELGEQLREQWAEYDPLPGAKDAPHRRGMAAALPTVTAVSRTSLFAGRLMLGSQRDEKELARRHRFWSGNRAVAVFHKDDLRGESGGDVFSDELAKALATDEVDVAVVLNTVDDRLAKEHKPGDATWRLAEIGKLRELLRMAAGQGRAVIITSDHGHVVERGSVTVPAGDALSARHRAPGGSVGDREIVLSGPRVVSPQTGGSIVALWDADARYTALKAGYHGGASLAEVTIPVLAFLPFGAAPPKGWRELGSPRPHWWTSTSVTEQVRPSTVTASTSHQPSASVTATSAHGSSAGPAPSQDNLVAWLLGSQNFQDQCQLLGRKPDLAKVEAAVRELLDAGGTLPVTALAQRIGEQAKRADGFAAVLRQILNFDGIQVLETLPDGRTLRLNVGLLRDQFEL